MHWDQLAILHINLLPDKGDPPHLTQELRWTALYACTQTLTSKATAASVRHSLRGSLQHCTVPRWAKK